jgi:hypothetical protein
LRHDRHRVLRRLFTRLLPGVLVEALAHGKGGAMSTRSTFTITLQDDGKGAPSEIKLRRLLKIAGRALGLKCIDVAEVGRTIRTCRWRPAKDPRPPPTHTKAAKPLLSVVRARE